jgi:hypothetical protein
VQLAKIVMEFYVPFVDPTEARNATATIEFIRSPV